MAIQKPPAMGDEGMKRFLIYLLERDGSVALTRYVHADTRREAVVKAAKQFYWPAIAIHAELR